MYACKLTCLLYAGICTYVQTHTLAHTYVLYKLFTLYTLYICNSYNMGKRDLPDIYAIARGPQAQGRGHIYQANPDCPSYK